MNLVDPSLLRDFVDSYLPDYLNVYEKNKEAVAHISHMLCMSNDVIGYWALPTIQCFMQDVIFTGDYEYKSMGVWMAEKFSMSIDDFESMVTTGNMTLDWALFEWACVVPLGGRSIWSRTGYEFPLSKRSSVILEYIMDDIFGESPYRMDFFRKLCRRLQIREILKLRTSLSADIIKEIIEHV
jgi:hypothetical protein